MLLNSQCPKIFFIYIDTGILIEKNMFVRKFEIEKIQLPTKNAYNKKYQAKKNNIIVKKEDFLSVF